MTEDPIQVMFTGRIEAMRQAEKSLHCTPERANFALAVTYYEDRDFGMVDVIRPNCSKGATLAEWTAQRGLSREDVMAIGDNFNDREMLEFAGLPVVMANGVPELKLLGWRETLSNDDLIAEKYHGIRPAPGYPACPDHLVKRDMFDVLQAPEIGMSVTESLAMLPAASVSGFYLAHPDSTYFSVGKIAQDQLEDYAKRMSLSKTDAERALAPLL